MDVDKSSRLGITPLMLACVRENLDIIKYLVEITRADVNKKDRNNVTALNISRAMRKLDIAQYLVENGAQENRNHTEIQFLNL